MSAGLFPRALRTARRQLYKPLLQQPKPLEPTARLFSTPQKDDHIRIVEVGPRDGLQNEKHTIPAETKIELVNRLAATGLEVIEAGSFVSPKWTPQMAASDTVLESLLTNPCTTPSGAPITYQWLLPNTKGLDSFLKVMETTTPPSTSTTKLCARNRHEISIFLAATETFSKKNTNCTIAESLQRFSTLISASRAAGFPVRAYISVALGCPFEGPDTDPHVVADLAASLLEMGADEISVADTTGMGTAPRTRELLRTLKSAGIQSSDLALHFHDTFGQALVNTMISLEFGVRTFDAAVGGLGGCPYSPGATGNLATEDLVYFLQSLGVRTAVDLESLSEVGEWISAELGKGNGSSVGRATMSRLRREGRV